MLFIVFLWLGSLFIQVEKSFFFQFLMLFIAFPCLGSLFRNREAFFFSFPCNLLFFSIQVCCLEIKESLFKISFVIYCFSLFSFAVYKQGSGFFFFIFLCYLLFLCVQDFCLEIEKFCFYIYIYIYILCYLLFFSVGFSAQKQRRVFFSFNFYVFYCFSLAFLFGNKEDFSFSSFYVFLSFYFFSVQAFCLVNKGVFLLRGHNWVHFTHRLQCSVTLNSNFAILET